MISHIIDNIYLGNMEDASHCDVYEIVDYIFDVRSGFMQDEESIFEPYYPMFANLLTSAKKLVKNNKVLFYCVAGQDRSPFFVASLLWWLEYYHTAERAYLAVKAKRPEIFLHYEWF